MGENKTVKAYTLDQLREYLIINDVEIKSKEDFVEIYLKMNSEGYFYKAHLSESMDEVRDAFSILADAYTKDKDIVEKDLIMFGSKRVLEKINSNRSAKR